MGKAKKPKVERATILKDLRELLPQDMEATAHWPLLVDLLMPRRDDQGITREAGILRVVAQGSMWAVSIACASEGVQCVLYMETLFGLLEEIERQLGNGRLHWVETWEARKKARQRKGD